MTRCSTAIRAGYSPKREKGWDVVDVHGPMKRYLAAARARPGLPACRRWCPHRRHRSLAHGPRDPAPRGIPAGAVAGTTSGEKVLGSRPHGAEVLELVKQRQRVLKDAWLTATGHRRPGMTQGLPLREAEGQAQEIEGQIRKLVASEP
jgi:hypothetical protein